MLRTSLTGLQASSKDLSVVANNLANASTTGFKRSAAQFSDIIADESAVRPGASIGKGVMTMSVVRTTGQGAMVSTGSTLDIAIDGGGYFAFGVAPDGIPGETTTYSRAGHLTMDSSGNLVDDTGAQLLGSAALSGNLQASSLQGINVLSKVGGDASNISGGNFCLLQSGFGNGQLSGPDLFRIMLHPARLREMLGKLLLRRGLDPHRGVKHDGPA
jgi:flagellar hook protein FlgE